MENEFDVRFREIVGSVSRITEVFCSNISQKDLRDALFVLRRRSAIVEKYLDIRNEQGRGGK